MKWAGLRTTFAARCRFSYAWTTVYIATQTVEATQGVTIRILTAFLANSTGTEWTLSVVLSAIIFAVRIPQLYLLSEF